MRSTHWLLGIVLGAFVGGSALEAGVLALLVVLPALVWAARETARPLGFGGLLLGAAVGGGGLVAAADARCAADQGCSMPDQSLYLILVLVLLADGAFVTFLGWRGRSRPAPRDG